VFASIGTGLSAPNHSPKFKADPVALLPAAKYLAALAEGALRKLAIDKKKSLTENHSSHPCLHYRVIFLPAS